MNLFGFAERFEESSASTLAFVREIPRANVSWLHAAPVEHGLSWAPMSQMFEVQLEGADVRLEHVPIRPPTLMEPLRREQYGSAISDNVYRHYTTWVETASRAHPHAAPIVAVQTTKGWAVNLSTECGRSAVVAY